MASAPRASRGIEAGWLVFCRDDLEALASEGPHGLTALGGSRNAVVRPGVAHVVDCSELVNVGGLLQRRLVWARKDLTTG